MTTLLKENIKESETHTYLRPMGRETMTNMCHLQRLTNTPIARNLVFGIWIWNFH